MHIPYYCMYFNVSSIVGQDGATLGAARSKGASCDVIIR